MIWCVFVPLSAVAAEAGFSGAARFRDGQLDLWRSPEFQRRFTESYLAETEIEPTLAERDYKTMMKVRDLLTAASEAEDDALKAKRTEEAVALLEKHVTETASAVFDFTLANLLFQQEAFEPAIVAYERAVEKYPKFRRAWKNLGLLHVQNQDFKQAIPALTRVIELGGGDVLTYARLAFAYTQVENYLSAETAYRMAVLLDPESVNWKKGLAYCLFRQQRYQEATALCRSLVAEFPDDASLWLMQADAYIGQNKPMQAAINYEMVDRMGESTVKSLNNLGDIYINEELFGTAITYYLRAFEKDPAANTERMIRAAKAFTARGAFAETKLILQSLETHLGENLDEQNRKELLRLHAQIAVAEGNAEQEVKVLEEIVALDPLDGKALILLGQNSDRQEDYERAVFYFERAANLEDHEAEAKMRHGQMLVRQGKYREALPLLRRALDIKPRDDLQKYIEQVERVAK
jgi:tetratricopeptide (TPR) repeat protein